MVTSTAQRHPKNRQTACHTTITCNTVWGWGCACMQYTSNDAVLPSGKHCSINWSRETAWMSCFCLPSRRDKTFFHWPNFTFSHSQHSINPKRIHSTFSLAHKHKSRRVLRRRHTLHNGTAVADLRKPKKSHKTLKTTKTSPAVIDLYNMSEQYTHPPGPPPDYQAHQAYQSNLLSHPGRPHVSWAQTGTRSSEPASNNPFRNAHANDSQEPPQSNSEPPPEYEAPPGPPPSWEDKKSPMVDEDYAPPAEPPPSHQTNEPEPPPYDPWLAIPDNALLPPPPSIREERSPASNASWDDAARGHDWCRRNPLWAARRHNQQTLSRISNGDINLTTPPDTRNVRLSRIDIGRTQVRTNPQCTDTIFLSDIPLYPATTGRPRTIYFELRVHSMHQGGTGSEEAEAGISIGFLAPPYPSWRRKQFLGGIRQAACGCYSPSGCLSLVSCSIPRLKHCEFTSRGKLGSLQCLRRCP